jgi:hypothetical protein
MHDALDALCFVRAPLVPSGVLLASNLGVLLFWSAWLPFGYLLVLLCYPLDMVGVSAPGTIVLPLV